MAAKTVNYQCPACTGPLQFSAQTGRLECEYCGSSYDVAEIEKLYAKKEEQAAAAQAAAESGEGQSWNTAEAGSIWSDQEAAGLHAYSCPSCGAEIVCDTTTAATACVYCGNPTVVPGQLDGMLKPDYVIPFKLDKKAATDALKAYYKGKRLLPKAFTAGNHIDEIKGVYVPFWLFDGEADAEIQVDAIRTNTTRTSSEEITHTEHFLVERAGTIQFERVPVDGSSKMPDEHMDAIEPFDYSEMVKFSTAYLPGYLADKYDVDADASCPRADLRVENTAVRLLENSVTGYSGTTTTAKNVKLKHGQVKYAMLPVWMLHTSWNGKNYLFAMNGQTGKLIGDLPVSKGKFFAWLAGIAAPLMIILALLTNLL